MLENRLNKLLILSALVGVLLTVSLAHWIGWNSSPSAAPVGFYWRRAKPLKRGDLAEVCLPAAVAEFGLARGYIGYGSCPGDAESVGKIILGMPGDTITVDPATVLKTDSLGRPIEHFPFGKYQLKPGEIWLHGSARNSWDGRYFGPVPIANVRAHLSPLWTWGQSR